MVGAQREPTFGEIDDVAMARLIGTGNKRGRESSFHAGSGAALSLPLVVLFGGHSQAEWLPRSPSRSPVIGIGGPPISTRLDQISADAVFSTWLTLLDQMKAQTGGAARK